MRALQLITMDMAVMENQTSTPEVPSPTAKLESVQSIAEKKRKMTLNFVGDCSTSSSTRKRRSVITSLSSVSPSNDSASSNEDIMSFLQPGNGAFLLTSPDISMLKMSSPELEHLIIQGIITGTNSWTPTNSVASLFAPSTNLPTVQSMFTAGSSMIKTDETMAEADVFAKFLNDLHSPTFYSLMATPSHAPDLSASLQNPESPLPGPPNQVYTARENENSHTSLAYQHQLYLRTNSGSCSPQSSRSKSPSPRERRPTPPIYDYVDYSTRLRRRPARASFGQTYQERYGNGDLSTSDGDQDEPCSPLSSLDSDLSTSYSSYTYDSIKYALRDVDEQFRLKSERKRERNRLAAAKCRKRKMDKIGTLGQQVDVMKGEVEHLEGAAAFLRRQIWHLRNELLTHLNHGCLIAEVLPALPPTDSGA